MERNPFVINFGKVPSQYISRELIIDEIVQEMTDEDSQNTCFIVKKRRYASLYRLRKDYEIYRLPRGESACNRAFCLALGNRNYRTSYGLRRIRSDIK